MEIWRTISDFPMYDVSSYGRIRNSTTDRIMRMNQNQFGVVYVGLWRDGTQYIRSVSKLVAEAFVQRRYSRFDTPINLDGDRWNNHVDNLVWRPRWFAVKYNRQFKQGYLNHIPYKIEDIDSGEVFLNSFDCAIYYGVLEKDLVHGIVNQTNVWPVDRYFRVLPH